MAGWLAYASKTADVEAACRTCEVGMGEYLTARRLDAAFSLACVEIDLIVREAAVSRLECAAARGVANVGQLKLLLSSIESLRTVAGDGPPPAGSIPSDAPAWLADVAALVTPGSARYHPVAPYAFGSTLRQVVAQIAADPGLEPFAFNSAGPCVECRSGLAILCPNPACSTPLIVRNYSELPRPSDERWEEYELVDGEPVADRPRRVGTACPDEDGGDDAL
jgi:hypothetical protein